MGLQPPAQFLIPLALGPQTRWSSAPGNFPKPSLSVSPRGVTEPGENVTFRCVGEQPGMRFVLSKNGAYKKIQDPSGSEAVFPIPSVGPDDSGIYTCQYHTKSQTADWSEPSDPVELVVPGEGATSLQPHTDISLSPSGGVSLGGVVTVWCRGQLRGVRFMLNKEGRHFPPVDSAGFEVVFPISNVSREHGGNYSCSYHSRSEPFTVSYPSDPVELVLRDPSLPRPSISLSPTGVTAPGADVTIRCQGQRRNVTFFLHKAGDLNPQRHMDPAGDGAEFHIPTVGHQHGGSYSCSYRPQSEPFVSSEPSNPVQLVVAGEGPSSVSLLPTPPPAGSSGRFSTDAMLRARLCPELWARQRGRPAREWGQSHWGVPQPGGAADTQDLGQREGGSRELQSREGLFQATHQLGGDGQSYGGSNSGWVGPRHEWEGQPPAPHSLPDPQPPQCLLPCRSLPRICWGMPGEGQDLGGWTVKLGPTRCHSPGAITPLLGPHDIPLAIGVSITQNSLCSCFPSPQWGPRGPLSLPAVDVLLPLAVPWSPGPWPPPEGGGQLLKYQFLPPPVRTAWLCLAAAEIPRGQAHLTADRPGQRHLWGWTEGSYGDRELGWFPVLGG
uniref:Ig-like domain-containing protein n=1 Tax=Chrysemys picta bellii TaxID=8478 RepID=A0A8C3FXW9_CHRPI